MYFSRCPHSPHISHACKQVVSRFCAMEGGTQVGGLTFFLGVHVKKSKLVKKMNK